MPCTVLSNCDVVLRSRVTQWHLDNGQEDSNDFYVTTTTRDLTVNISSVRSAAPNNFWHSASSAWTKTSTIISVLMLPLPQLPTAGAVQFRNVFKAFWFTVHTSRYIPVGQFHCTIHTDVFNALHSDILMIHATVALHPYIFNLKMIGKGFVLFEINSSPSAFYIIKPTCISWLVFKV